MSIFSSAFNPVAADANAVLKNVDCDPSVSVGDAVRIEAGIAIQAIADNFHNANVLGICEAKASPTVCDIRVSGVTLPIYSALVESEDYYLSPTDPGKLTIVAPSLSGEILLRVGQPFDPERMTVFKGTRIRRA